MIRSRVLALSAIPVNESQKLVKSGHWHADGAGLHDLPD